MKVIIVKEDTSLDQNVLMEFAVCINNLWNLMGKKSVELFSIQFQSPPNNKQLQQPAIPAIREMCELNGICDEAIECGGKLCVEARRNIQTC